MNTIESYFSKHDRGMVIHNNIRSESETETMTMQLWISLTTISMVSRFYENALAQSAAYLVVVVASRTRFCSNFSFIIKTRKIPINKF